MSKAYWVEEWKMRGWATGVHSRWFIQSDYDTRLNKLNLPYVWVKRNKKNKKNTLETNTKREHFPEIQNKDQVERTCHPCWHIERIFSTANSHCNTYNVLLYCKDWLVFPWPKWKFLVPNPTQKSLTGQRLVSLSLIHPQLACSPRSFWWTSFEFPSHCHLLVCPEQIARPPPFEPAGAGIWLWMAIEGYQKKHHFISHKHAPHHFKSSSQHSTEQVGVDQIIVVVRKLYKVHQGVAFEDKRELVSSRAPVGHAGGDTQVHLEGYLLMWRQKGRSVFMLTRLPTSMMSRPHLSDFAELPHSF